jgi:hypothetical protein
MVFNCKDHEVARAVLVTCRLAFLAWLLLFTFSPVTAATKSRTIILIGQACLVWIGASVPSLPLRIFVGLRSPCGSFFGEANFEIQKIQRRIRQQFIANSRHDEV